MKKATIRKIAVSILSIALLMQNVLASDVVQADKSAEADLVSAAIARYEETADTRTMEQRLNEEASLIQYQSLIEEIQESAFMSDEVSYPEYYAGAYINDDGNLVVRILPGAVGARMQVADITDNPEIIIESAEHSLTELLNMQNVIDEHVSSSEEIEDPELRNLLESIATTSQSEEDGQVIVSIRDLTPEKEELFFEYFGDVDFITLEDGDTPELAKSWYPGGIVWNEEGDDRYSLGWPADYYNSAGEVETGFVTAGHCVSDGGGVYGFTNNRTVQIGTCITSVFSGKCDGALVELTSGHNIEEETDYQGISLKRTKNLVIATGATIYKEGASTYYTTGTLKETNVTCNYTEGTIRGLFYSTNECEGGDSGGIVYCKSGGSYYAVGQTSGKEDSTGYTYTCQLLNTLSPLDCSYVYL